MDLNGINVVYAANLCKVSKRNNGTMLEWSGYVSRRHQVRVGRVARVGNTTKVERAKLLVLTVTHQGGKSVEGNFWSSVLCPTMF